MPYRRFSRRSSAFRTPTTERVSEFFLPEKGNKVVRRFELQAVLSQYHRAQRQDRPLLRLWRWLKAPLGSVQDRTAETSTLPTVDLERRV